MKYLMLSIFLVFGVIFTGCGTTNPQKGTEISNQSDTQKDTEISNNQSDTQENTHKSYQIHMQGERCARCHSLSNLDSASLRTDYDSDERFTSGVTLYETLDSTLATQTYTIQLLLTGGEIQKYQAGKGSGNFHGTFNDGIDTYTPQILDAKGNVVRSSLTDSHNATRFDCNSCHTASGANGAAGRVFAKSATTVATNPPTTNTSTTSTPTTTTDITTMKFAANVLPILRNRCASCHGSSGRFSITHSTSPYAGVVPFINTSSPTSSRLLLKASGSVGHGGGRVFSTTSSSYSTVLNWINAGGLNN